MPNSPLLALLRNSRPLQQERYYSLRVAGELLGVSLQQARRYARQGLLRSVRVGKLGRFRVPQSAIEQFLGKSDETQETATTTAK